jgi:hypothetical protein
MELFYIYNIIISDQNRIMIRSFLNEASDFPQSKTGTTLSIHIFFTFFHLIHRPLINLILLI